MLTLAAALLLTAGSAAAPSGLVSTAPWWEKITMTIAAGKPQACEYESSLSPGAKESCEVDSSPALTRAGADEPTGVYTRMTFERRFSLDAPDAGKLEPGDTVLGTQVMALSIDGAGAVRSCQVLVASGDTPPGYGCREIRAERFEASAGASSKQARQAYMTVLVYGHSAQLAD